VAAPASSVAPAIVLDGLRKRFGDVEAVKGVSFEVAQGEIFGIVGPNGAGKTTTLEMIEGLRPPDGGSVSVLGEPVWPNPASVQRKIGVQLQATALFDYLTTFELLELFQRFYGPADRSAIEDVLALVGLEEKAQARVTTLSGGQQQRVAIALALVHEPAIVFLDEPTTGLDPQARRNLWDIIAAVGSEGRTVVLTTHYMEEAERLCDRVAIMDGGEVIALDTPVGLVRDLGAAATVVFRAQPDLGDLEELPAVTGVSERDDGMTELVTRDVPATLAGLLAHGVPLDDLSVRRATLEDVFLTLTGREFRE
jgi:ABC-2 type transport system ATP-binding protein